MSGRKKTDEMEPIAEAPGHLATHIGKYIIGFLTAGGMATGIGGGTALQKLMAESIQPQVQQVQNNFESIQLSNQIINAKLNALGASGSIDMKKIEDEILTKHEDKKRREAAGLE